MAKTPPPFVTTEAMRDCARMVAMEYAEHLEDMGIEEGKKPSQLQAKQAMELLTNSATYNTLIAEVYKANPHLDPEKMKHADRRSAATQFKSAVNGTIIEEALKADLRSIPQPITTSVQSERQ